MSIEILKHDIKKGTLKQVYLFFGPEVYLKNHYLKQLEALLVSSDFRDFNYTILEGREGTKNVIDTCETVPVMSDKKMAVIRESGMFHPEGKTKNKKSGEDSRDALIEYLSKLPPWVYIVFAEDDIDKRSRMYKAVKDKGVCVEFDYQKPEELTKWVIRIFNSYRIRIGKAEAAYLVSLCSPGMIDILNEINKLVGYIGEGSEINTEDIENICTKSLQNKIFDMIDAITQKKPERAYKLLDDMLMLKEPIQRISILISRHFKLMFYIKEMNTKGCSEVEVGEHVQLQPYIVGKYLKQCQKYSIQSLREALEDCLDMDCRVKTGRIEPRTAIETLIAKYAV